MSHDGYESRQIILLQRVGSCGEVVHLDIVIDGTVAVLTWLRPKSRKFCYSDLAAEVCKDRNVFGPKTCDIIGELNVDISAVPLQCGLKLNRKI